MKKECLLLALAILLGTSSRLSAQIDRNGPIAASPDNTYTYEIESFEESVWSAAPNNSTPVVSSTGEWTVAKNNIQNTSVAQHGTYSLLLATKGNALISPQLPYGAGALTFYLTKSTGGGRTIMVSTSTDKVTWSADVDTRSVPSEWTYCRVEINDPAVKYIRFQTNSNGSVYIDNIKMTAAGAADLSVVTSEVSQITQTSALAGGTVSVSGGSEIVSRGVCWNTTGFPDTSSALIEAPGTTGEFTVACTNLNPGNSYYLRAYAATAYSVTYGNEVRFSTRSADASLAYWLQDFNDAAHLPASNPSNPVEIDVPGQGTWIYKGAYKATNPLYIQDGSVMNLRLTKNNSYVVTPLLEDGVTELSFWEGRGDRELTVYTSADGGTQWTLFKVVSSRKYEANIVSINSASANRIKIANESGGDADIDNLSLTVFPSGVPPTVTTLVASAIGKNTATTGGEVTAAGSKPPVERGVVWSVEPAPILADNRTIEFAGTGAFTAELTGLPAGTQIYYRAYARSRSGTGYGEAFALTTEPASAPMVSTLLAGNITAESALTGGIISDGGGAPIIAQGVCWSVSGEPDIAGNKTNDESETNTFTSKLQNLNPLTQYYYRAYATNVAGTGYGEILTFTTGNIALPAVTTSAISAILSYKATGGGTVVDNGNAPLSGGLCWNETGNPTIDDRKTVIADPEGSFTSNISHLRGGTIYYVRAYATNSAGTAYGNEISFTTSPVHVYYVSPNGNDATANGSHENPFYSLQKAIDLVEAGDSIVISGGTYHYSTRINIGKIGAPDGGTLSLVAPEGERALLDFSAMALDPNHQGIRITGSYWHIYGLDIQGAGDNGMLIERNKPDGGTAADIQNRTEEGHHNTVEFCTFFENKDTGLQMKNMAEYNRIINCDSYFNRDAEDGNADGFAPKLSVGTGNYFYGCRAWNNSDDGWDGILYDADEGFADDMTTVYENCWSFNNGFLKDGSESKGNGNGFKLGGSGNKDRRHNAMLINCLAFDNLMKGFDQNHNTGDMTLINCTGFANKYLNNKNHFTYKIDEDILAPGKKLTLTNCVAVWDGITDPDDSQYTPLRLMQGIRNTCDFLTSASDYVSTDTTGVRSPRKADGSLPDLPFMHIQAGNTKLIDAGTIVNGFNFNGIFIEDLGFNDRLPDLGCFETESATNGINENSILPTGSLLVYPQPVTEHCIVQIPADSKESRHKLRLFDLSGKLVYQKTFDGNSLLIERGNLGSGLYLLLLENERSGQNYQAKLIIQ
ncbi:MAG: T9SS type A sorting domain-containing protein [Dysgonamonadaceae bacterium]|jgi:hypothetical protein|nr:T9SS type A sorting domain-containing protein [Dysgonamonadaceae bacterium]